MFRFLTEYYPGAEMPMEEEVFLVVALFYLIFGLIMLVVGVVTYILQSLALYKMAARRGINNPWLAWIPVASMWTMGSLSDQYQYVTKGKVTNRRKILVGLEIALLVAYLAFYLFAFILGVMSGMAVESGAAVSPLLGLLALVIGLGMIAAAIVMTVFQYIVLYDIFNSADPNNAVLYFVLSILVNIALPILLFICRNKDGGMPPRKTAPVAEPPVFVPAAEPVAAPVAEETPVTEEGFAFPEEFVEEPAEPETTEPTE